MGKNGGGKAAILPKRLNIFGRWLLVGILFLAIIMPAKGAAAGVKAIVPNMASRTDGTLWAWRSNDHGLVGLGLCRRQVRSHLN